MRTQIGFTLYCAKTIHCISFSHGFAQFILRKTDQTLIITESCFRHPLFDLRGTRKVDIRHTNFHFSSKKVTSKSGKLEVFDLTIVNKTFNFSTSRLSRQVQIRKHYFQFFALTARSKIRKVEVFHVTIVNKTSTFRPRRKVEKLKSRKVEKLKSRKVKFF